MNAPHGAALTLPRLSRRAESLGTENAFVVLAEVNALIRQGKDIISFCIGQPDFPTPAKRPGRGHRGDPRRQARLHAQRRHRRIARGRGARSRLAAGPRHRRGRCGRRRRRQALHRLHDRLGHRLRRRRRSHLSGAGISDLRIADPRQRRGARAHLPARIARVCLRPGRARIQDHAEHAAPDPQHAAKPDRRHPRPRESRRHCRDPPAPPAGMDIRRRDLFAPRVRRALRLARHASRHAGAHDHQRRRVEDVGDDRLANRLCRQPRAGARVHALDHQYRILRVADFAVGGGGRDHRAAGRGRRDARELPRTARPHRAAVERRSRHHVRHTRRRLLCVAQRDRGVQAHRLRGLGSVSQAPAARGGHRGAGGHPFRPPRSRRRPAHPLLLCRVQRGDRERHCAPGRFRSQGAGSNGCCR